MGKACKEGGKAGWDGETEERSSREEGRKSDKKVNGNCSAVNELASFTVLWMGIEAFIRLKNFLCRHDALMLHYYLLLISPKVEISASRLVGIVAVGILLQYIFNEL